MRAQRGGSGASEGRRGGESPASSSRSHVSRVASRLELTRLVVLLVRPDLQQLRLLLSAQRETLSSLPRPQGRSSDHQPSTLRQLGFQAERTNGSSSSSSSLRISSLELTRSVVHHRAPPLKLSSRSRSTGSRPRPSRGLTKEVRSPFLLPVLPPELRPLELTAFSSNPS